MTMDAFQSRTVTVALTRDDYLLAQSNLGAAKGAARFVTPALVCVAAAAGFAAAAWGGMAFLRLSLEQAAPLGLAAALGCAWVVGARLVRRSLTDALRNDGAFLRPFKFTAAGAGVIVESDVARTELTWRGVLAIEATPDQILLRIDGQAAVILPRSAFADVAAMRAFGDHLRTLKREGGDVWALREPVVVKTEAAS
jgi:hypothetical protein